MSDASRGHIPADEHAVYAISVAAELSGAASNRFDCGSNTDCSPQRARRGTGGTAPMT